MFAALGEITFETLTSPEAMRLSSAYSYAEHKVVEARPRLQWLAQELQKISLELGFHVAFTNPKRELDALRAAAQDHQARALVFANGIHRGYFVIESLEETHQQLAGDGSYIAVTARLELREWVPGAEFDPLRAPRRPAPPGLVASPASPASPPSAASSSPAPLSSSATPYESQQPIGPHNLLPVSEIVRLRQAGTGPGVTYSRAPYAQPGMSGLAQQGTTPQPPAQSFTTVAPASIVRAV